MIDAAFLTDWLGAILEHFDNNLTDPTEETL